MVMKVHPPTAVDWRELERRARGVAVARAPFVPVMVGFWPEGRGGPMLTATWTGQVYGPLAVAAVGAVGVEWGLLDLDRLTTLSVERGAALARTLVEWDARYGTRLEVPWPPEQAIAKGR